MARVAIRTIVVLLGVAALGVPAGSADAAWSATRAGTGGAKAVTVGAPAGFTVTCQPLQLTTPKLAWTAVPYAAKYDIYRKSGNGANTLIAGAQTLTNFTDNTGLPGGLGLTWSVVYSIQAVQIGGATSVWRSATATAPAISVTLGACIL